MKKEYLLVDGYNIVFDWENLKKIADRYSLYEAREKLISILSNYQGATGIHIIIVFDAHLVKGGSGNYEKRGDIDIIFTKEAETADHYIERTTNSLTKEGLVKVATSDRIEQIIIMGKGAIRMSARELKVNVRHTAIETAKRIEDIKPIKNNMLFDNLDEHTAKWFENMRQNKNI